MFGTYVEEQEEPVYGITTPLRSWNPVWANLHYWVDLFGKARRAARPVDKVRLFLARPGWHPEDLGGFQAPPEVDAARAEKFATPAPLGLKVYAFVQFAITMAVGSVFMFRQGSWPPGTRWMTAAFIVAGLVAEGGLFERRRWAVPLEVARLAAAVPLVHSAAILHASWTPAVITAVAALAVSAWLWHVARGSSAGTLA
jgi:hypothetical protein